MSTFIPGLVALSGAVQTVIAHDERACLRAARSITQTAGLAQVSCVEVTRGSDGRFALTGKPVLIVWQRAQAPTPTGGSQGCKSYEQQRIDNAREPMRLDIRVLP